jgi:hypothetical protein
MLSPGMSCRVFCETEPKCIHNIQGNIFVVTAVRTSELTKSGNLSPIEL